MREWRGERERDELVEVALVKVTCDKIKQVPTVGVSLGLILDDTCLISEQHDNMTSMQLAWLVF